VFHNVARDTVHGQASKMQDARELNPSISTTQNPGFFPVAGEINLDATNLVHG